MGWPRNIVILTGAGISAESGLATFRGAGRAVGGASGRGCGDARGLCPRSGAGAQILRRAPGAAGRGRAQCRARGAGPARRRMAGRAADRHPECRRPARARRGEAAAPHAWRADQRLVPGLRRAVRLGRGRWARGRACPVCQVAGRVRPDIVWFGEMPYEMERIDQALMDADLFVSIGTSGAVYPAAGFVQTARYCGAQDAGDQSRAEPGQHLLRRAPLRAGGRRGAERG